jgi:hypothetical protein
VITAVVHTLRLQEEPMFSFRIIRFRSLERDRTADERRVALIQKAVLSAVAEAEDEAKRLRVRISKVRSSAIFLVEQVDDHELAPTCLADLTSVEKHLLADERRLAQLRDHLAFLRSIEIAARVNEQADPRSVIAFSTGVPSGICTDDPTQRRR